MILSLLLYYVLLSYVVCIGFVSYSLYDLSKKKILKNNFKEDSKYLIPFALFIAFSPITIWFFTYTLIKEQIFDKRK